MASAHSEFHRSTSYENWGNGRSDDLSTPRPPLYPQERSRSARPPRPRTPSRVRPPRPRSPSRVRKPYTSNCARRRWPPSPRVEDESASLKKELSKEGKPIPAVVEDDGVKMRGTPDQNPIVKDVEDDADSSISTTSSEESESATPPRTAKDKRNNRHALRSEVNDRIALTNGDLKYTSTGARRTPVPRERERGRRDVPKLDTELARDKSRGDIPPPLERARSPYASGPRPARPKEDRFSTEYTLTPDTLSPGVKYADNQRSHSYYDPRFAKSDAPGSLHQVKHDLKGSGQPNLASSDRHTSVAYENTIMRDKDRERVQRRDSHDRPIRPPLAPLGRHASAAAVYSGVQHPHNTARTQPVHHHGSSDESDADRGSGTHRRKHNLLSAQDSPKSSAPHLNDRPRQQHSSRQPTPTPPDSAAEHRGPPANRASLLSGDFLLGINARLEKDIAGARRASPRPSPQPSPLASPRDSPTASPFSSPPRTPPNEPHHRRTHTGTGLKNEIQRSRPPSPSMNNLTPRTPKTSGTLVHPVEGDLTGGSRHPVPRSRMTTPLPSPPITLQPQPILEPGKGVRSPSFAMPANYRPEVTHAPRYTVNVHTSMTPIALAPPPSATLRPGFSARQRSASYTDLRPQLTVDTPAYLQSADSQRSPGARTRPSSPSISSPSDRYKPANLERPSPGRRSTSQLLVSQTEQPLQRPQRSRSRANSYVPEAYAAAAGLKPSNTGLAANISDYTSRPSAPVSSSNAPAQPQKPVIVPLCPRPQPLAGYKDWYTLNDYSRLAICPGCRHNVFGARYGHHLTPRDPEPHGEETLCDLNDPWTRLATQMTMDQNRSDLGLLRALAKSTANQRPCMQDKPMARHHWYRFEDETGKVVPDFYVCRHCVFSLESICPVLDDVFYSSKAHHGDVKERVCSLRSNSRHFVQYIAALDQIATEARKSHKEPNTAALARLVKKLTQDPESPKPRTTTPPDQSPSSLVRVPPCPRDVRNRNFPWHIHPHIPEFTVCPACYAEVVRPAVTAGHHIARAFDHSPHKVEQEVSCQLYSAPMRRTFREACEDDDFEHLRHKAHRLHLLQQDLWDVMEERKDHPDDEEVKERGRRLFEEWNSKYN